MNDVRRPRWAHRLVLCLTLLAFVTPGAAMALVREVPLGYATITSALSVAAVGDTVRVAAGVYSPTTNSETFPLVIPDGVTLLGAGREETVLDAEDSAAVLEFPSGAAVVRAVQVTGGHGDWGGGARILGGSPEIAECLFLRNRALRRGSGINVQGTATPWIHHNVIWESSDVDLSHPGDPHGVQLGENSAGIVEHNLIGRGDSNGLLVGEDAAPIVRHNIFFENGIEGVRGRGICNLGDPSAVISHNLFFGNVVAAMVFPDPEGGFIDTTAVAASSFDAADSVYGNLDGDPQLVSPGLLIFQLQSSSPAIDAGDPSLPGDPDGTVADLGPFYYASPVSAPSAPGFLARLLPNFPNPFNPRTTIRFELDRRAEVHLDILDSRGRQIRQLWTGLLAAGSHSRIWDGTDEGGRAVASGVYHVRLNAHGSVLGNRVTLLR